MHLVRGVRGLAPRFPTRAFSLHHERLFDTLGVTKTAVVVTLDFSEGYPHKVTKLQRL